MSPKTLTGIRLLRLITSFGVILNQCTIICQRLHLSDTQGPFLVCYLRKAMSLAPFFTLSPVSQPWGWNCFLRWIVRSDTGCFCLRDILEAKGELWITNVSTGCITEWHADSQLISLFKWRGMFNPFTPAQIHICTSSKTTAEITRQGRPVKDKNLPNEKMA